MTSFGEATVGFTTNISTSIQTADITMANKACPACSWMNVFNLESSSSIEVERDHGERECFNPH
jgi:hypothetical protein